MHGRLWNRHKMTTIALLLKISFKMRPNKSVENEIEELDL